MSFIYSTSTVRISMIPSLFCQVTSFCLIFMQLHGVWCMGVIVSLPLFLTISVFLHSHYSSKWQADNFLLFLPVQNDSENFVGKVKIQQLIMCRVNTDIYINYVAQLIKGLLFEHTGVYIYAIQQQTFVSIFQ